MQETPYLKMFLQGTPALRGQEHLIERFNKLPYLDLFNEEYLRIILELSKIRKYDPGETIILEGMHDRWLYIILSGEVTIMRKNEEIQKLRQVGDLFGEMAIIENKARSASVIAANETTCLAIDASVIGALKEEERKSFCSLFYQGLAGILSHRLRATNEELFKVKERLRTANEKLAQAQGELALYREKSRCADGE